MPTRRPTVMLRYRAEVPRHLTSSLSRRKHLALLQRAVMPPQCSRTFRGYRALRRRCVALTTAATSDVLKPPYGSSAQRAAWGRLTQRLPLVVRLTSFFPRPIPRNARSIGCAE